MEYRAEQEEREAMEQCASESSASLMNTLIGPSQPVCVWSALHVLQEKATVAADLEKARQQATELIEQIATLTKNVRTTPSSHVASL